MAVLQAEMDENDGIRDSGSGFAMESKGSTFRAACVDCML